MDILLLICVFGVVVIGEDSDEIFRSTLISIESNKYLFNDFISSSSYYFEWDWYDFEFTENNDNREESGGIDIEYISLVIDNNDVDGTGIFIGNESIKSISLHNNNDYIDYINGKMNIEIDYDNNGYIFDELYKSIESSTSSILIIKRRRLGWRRWCWHRVKGRFISTCHAMQWKHAQSVCRHHWGDLASIQTKQEQRQVKEVCADQYRGDCWIGYHKPWGHWEDGRRPAYLKWSPGEPNDVNENEDCAEIKTNGLWNDIKCTDHRIPICERPRVHFVGHYYSVMKKLNWWAAYHRCDQLTSTRLATIENARENIIVRRACAALDPEGGCWLGLHHPWRHFVDGQSADVTNWADNEPNMQGRHPKCAYISETQRWKAAYCGERKYFVCNTINHGHRIKRRAEAKKKQEEYDEKISQKRRKIEDQIMDQYMQTHQLGTINSNLPQEEGQNSIINRIHQQDLLNSLPVIPDTHVAQIFTQNEPKEHPEPQQQYPQQHIKPHPEGTLQHMMMQQYPPGYNPWNYGITQQQQHPLMKPGMQHPYMNPSTGEWMFPNTNGAGGYHDAYSHPQQQQQQQHPQMPQVVGNPYGDGVHPNFMLQQPGTPVSMTGHDDYHSTGPLSKEELHRRYGSLGLNTPQQPQHIEGQPLQVKLMERRRLIDQHINYHSLDKLCKFIKNKEICISNNYLYFKKYVKKIKKTKKDKIKRIFKPMYTGHVSLSSSNITDIHHDDYTQYDIYNEDMKLFRKYMEYQSFKYKKMMMNVSEFDDNDNSNSNITDLYYFTTISFGYDPDKYDGDNGMLYKQCFMYHAYFELCMNIDINNNNEMNIIINNDYNNLFNFTNDKQWDEITKTNNKYNYDKQIIMKCNHILSDIIQTKICIKQTYHRNINLLLYKAIVTFLTNKF